MSQQITDYVKLFEDLFFAHRQTFFEYGMESAFSRDMIQYVLDGGNIAVEALKTCILDDEQSDETRFETLLWLHHIDDDNTYEARFQLAVSALKSSSPMVRDGAGIALDCMEDIRALPALREAVQVEPIDSLREDLEVVIQSIEESLYE